MSKDIQFTFPNEKTKELIDRAYGTAKSHGFHDKELSPQHMLMLAISEVGEAVEADRRGNRADVLAFETRTNEHPDYNERFKAYIKDTTADELADVAIRIFDFCGANGVTPRYPYRVTVNQGKSFCENCYDLCACLAMYHDESSPTREQKIGGATTYTSNAENVTGTALGMIWAICEVYDIDLMKHIEWKMQYNESRPPKHGKNY